jgi:response regulator RpfG family c-di-GMP phosphodiesterase
MGEITVSQRWMKKKEVEKQLYEIFQLIEQVHEKMEKVIEDAIEEHYVQNKRQLERVERQFDNVEQQLRDVAEESEPSLSFASKLFFV